MPIAVGQAHRRSTEGRPCCRHRQQLCRLRQLGRGVGGGGAVSVVLSRRHHSQSDMVGPFRVSDARRSDRLAAAPASHSDRFCRPGEAVIDQHVTSSGEPASVKPLSIAILAMGGQGGGVLTDWIVKLAETQAWVAQSTSVPGVAQRTGATIYYVEMLQARDGTPPILSLMPTPGDVDIVIAAEMMEAGRSILRGLVTPDKTTLIASTHRSFAVSEKEVPGNGIGNSLTVVEAADFAAKRTIAFDMETLAIQNGSVISSALFGALAAADVLPFNRSAFEATIRSGGRGAETTLKAFNPAYDRVRQKPRDDVAASPHKRFDPLPESTGPPSLDQLV